MSNINAVALSGNLTRDPEYREFDNGNFVAELGLAVNRSVKKDDEYEDVPSFFDVKVWGGRGKAAARKLSKGSQVFVQGRLEQERWEKDGQNRSKVVVVAQAIEGPDFFKSRDDDRDLGAGAQPTEATVAAAADDDIPF